MRALKFLKMAVMILVAVAVFGWITKELWNWLIPSIFGLRRISIFEAIGLLLLGKILFGGFHKHGHHGSWKERREWKQRMDARWAEMSDEDRAKFRAGMRGPCNWGGRKHEPTATEGAQ
jgi:hypothetical protein